MSGKIIDGETCDATTTTIYSDEIRRATANQIEFIALKVDNAAGTLVGKAYLQVRDKADVVDWQKVPYENALTGAVAEEVDIASGTDLEQIFEYSGAAPRVRLVVERTSGASEAAGVNASHFRALAR